MLLLRRCPNCGWQYDPSDREDSCLMCGTSLKAAPEASGRQSVVYIVLTPHRILVTA